jgi:hypothetical protein
MQDPPDGRGGDALAETGRFALDPLVTPSGVVFGEPKYE